MRDRILVTFQESDLKKARHYIDIEGCVLATALHRMGYNPEVGGHGMVNIKTDKSSKFYGQPRGNDWFSYHTATGYHGDREIKRMNGYAVDLIGKTVELVHSRAPGLVVKVWRAIKAWIEL